MKLSDIKPNPDNPRIIRDAKFEQLKKSIKEFPAMLELRPMVVDADNVVLGGNMRLRALQDLGYTEIPEAWVKRAEELTEEEKRRFIIVDNVGYGEWDWETIANDWDADEVREWGLDVPGFRNENEDYEREIDSGNLDASGDSYLNSALRQIVLVYDIDTHKKTLDHLRNIGIDYGIDENNSAVVLKLIEYYNLNK